MASSQIFFNIYRQSIATRHTQFIPLRIQLHEMHHQLFPQRSLPRTFAVAPSSLSELLTLASNLFSPPPPACFDPQCQTNKDAIFVLSIALPLLAVAAAAAFVLNRKPPPGSFDDPETGTIFEAPQGTAEPIRDRFGELAFRPVSWTPMPVPETEAASGEAIRIDVGLVQRTQPRTFIFDKILRQPSQLVVVTLPRPLGIIFEEERSSGRAVIVELMEGGNAEQRCRRAALDPGLASTVPQVGDVLRGCTATNVVYPRGALLFGAQTPERAIVVYGAAGQRWPQVATALRRGLVADGDVTLVLERRID